MASSDSRPLCQPGQHTWIMVRKYVGIEDYDVHSVTNHDTGDTTGPSVLDPNQTWSFDLTLGDDANNDGYDEVLEEWVECKYCPAEIRGERIGEIE